MIYPNLRTPGFYSDVNINTERSGLPVNTHKVLFLTSDVPNINQLTPAAVYDKAGADELLGTNSEAGQMMTAAIKTNRFVSVEILGGVGNVGGVNPPPVISCEGATESLVLQVVRTGQGAGTTFYFEFEIDGNTVIYSQNDLTQFGITVDGDEFNSTLTNNSPNNIRMRIRLIQIGVPEFTFSVTESGAWSEVDGYYEVCLAPSSESVISCDGATDYMGFGQLNGDWDVYVDGVFYPSPYDPAATIRNNFSGVIQAENDGYADFWNLTNVLHRIRFVPKQNDEGMASYVLRSGNTNQSFMELEDGSIVFCLAPQQV